MDKGVYILTLSEPRKKKHQLQNTQNKEQFYIKLHEWFSKHNWEGLVTYHTSSDGGTVPSQMFYLQSL